MENLWALFVLHIKHINKVFSSSSFFFDLEEWNVDAFKQIYFHMINYNKKFLKACTSYYQNMLLNAVD